MGGRISEPVATLSIIPAAQIASVEAQKVLIVGQMLSGGTATADALIQDHPDDGSEDTLFDATSHLAGMVREFKKINKKSRLDLIPLDDNGAAVQATSIVTFSSGPATEDGEYVVTVGSSKNHKYTIAVTSGDEIADVGDALVAANVADTDAPFTSANINGQVTFTAANGGPTANDWHIECSGVATGITFAVTGWTDGSTNPVLTATLDVIENFRYQTILWPSLYGISDAQTEIDARFNSANDVKDGVVVQVLKGTFAELNSYASFNSQSIVIVGNKTVAKTLSKGTAIQEMPDIIAAQLCAIRALRYTDGAQLTQYMSTLAPTDQLGGRHIASLPYHNTALPNLNVPLADEFFTDTEISDFKDNGLSIVGPNRALSGVIFGDMITTYLTDTAGNADTSYKYLNTVDTASVIRDFFFQNYKSRYAQSRLTEGDLIAGKDMVNAGSFRAFCNRLYDILADDALVQAGRAAKKDFDENLSIVIDIAEGKITVDMAPLHVTQVRLMIGTIQVNFGT